MKFEDAIKRSIKSFLGGNIPKETDEMSPNGIYYTPDYFDAMAASLEENSSNKD